MSVVYENKVAIKNTFYGTLLTWAGSAFCLAGVLSMLSLAPTDVGQRRKYKKSKLNGENTLLISNEQPADENYGTAQHT